MDSEKKSTGLINFFEDSETQAKIKEELEPINRAIAWKKEWKDMPEFVQNAVEPHAKIIFRFLNQEDLDEFCELIGQKLNPKTKSAWHPPLDRGRNSLKRYIDES